MIEQTRDELETEIAMAHCACDTLQRIIACYKLSKRPSEKLLDQYTVATRWIREARERRIANGKIKKTL